MTLAGLKKCSPTTSCGRRVKFAILFKSKVEVFDARMAPGLRCRIERLEHLLLDLQVLEHRLDDEIRVRDVIIGQRAFDQRQAVCRILRQLKPPLLQRALVIPLDDAQALVERRPESSRAR